METEKNDIIECEIEDTGIYGEGITHVFGQTVFIPGAIRGEKVAARVVLSKPTFAHAVLTKIYSRSPFRREPSCPYFKQCGGCSLQHVAYKEQLKIKKDIVVNALKKYAGENFDVEDTVPSDNEFNYRNKISMPVRFDSKKGTVGGLFMHKSHKIVETDDCLLQKPRLFKAAKEALDFAKKCGLSGYDETSGRGDLRHIIVRSLEDELSLAFVLNGEKKKFEAALEESAVKECPKNVSVYININTAKNNVILGTETRLIYGEALAKVEALTVQTHPQAFFQVNDGVRDKLYNAVKEEIDYDVDVIDAYCGAGIMSAIVADKARKVIGIEISSAAVNSANALKRRCGKNNMSFIWGDCAQSIEKALDEVEEGKTSVILDPPKSGCDKSVIDALIKAKIGKIIYVSCNPATLARDIKMLKEGGYSLEKVRPFDMFPQTMSVETLAVLCALNNGNIELKVVL